MSFLQDVEATLARVYGQAVQVDPRLLAQRSPLPPRTFLARWLTNLKQVPGGGGRRERPSAGALLHAHPASLNPHTCTQVYTARRDFAAAYQISSYLQATRPGDVEELRDAVRWAAAVLPSAHGGGAAAAAAATCLAGRAGWHLARRQLQALGSCRTCLPHPRLPAGGAAVLPGPLARWVPRLVRAPAAAPAAGGQQWVVYAAALSRSMPRCPTHAPPAECREALSEYLARAPDDNEDAQRVRALLRSLDQQRGADG